MLLLYYGFVDCISRLFLGPMHNLENARAKSQQTDRQTAASILLPGLSYPLNFIREPLRSDQPPPLLIINRTREPRAQRAELGATFIRETQ